MSSGSPRLTGRASPRRRTNGHVVATATAPNAPMTASASRAEDTGPDPVAFDRRRRTLRQLTQLLGLPMLAHPLRSSFRHQTRHYNHVTLHEPIHRIVFWSRSPTPERRPSLVEPMPTGGVGHCASHQARAHRPGGAIPPRLESAPCVGWGPRPVRRECFTSAARQHGARGRSTAGRHGSAALRLGSASRRIQGRSGAPAWHVAPAHRQGVGVGFRLAQSGRPPPGVPDVGNQDRDRRRSGRSGQPHPAPL